MSDSFFRPADIIYTSPRLNFYGLLTTSMGEQNLLHHAIKSIRRSMDVGRIIFVNKNATQVKHFTPEIICIVTCLTRAQSISMFWVQSPAGCFVLLWWYQIGIDLENTWRLMWKTYTFCWTFSWIGLVNGL